MTGDPSENSPATPRIARLAWLPSPWLLSLWSLWWLWRYGAMQAMPGYGALGWQSAAGYLVDALLLDALFALLRWRAGDGELRGAARFEPPHPLGPAWLRMGAAALLTASALARAVDGLHCYLALRHVDAEFWQTLMEPSRLWQLRYVWFGVAVTSVMARALLHRDLLRAARVRRALRGMWVAAEGDAGKVAFSPVLRVFVHRDAMRAALSGCVGVWLSTVASGSSQALVVPAEWWVVGSLVELIFGG